MDALTISLELAAIKEKTRRLALWSLIVHAAAVVLFLVAATQPRPDSEDNFVITEITWLEPEVEIIEVPAQVAVAQPEPETSKPSVVVAEVKPEPVMPAKDTSVDLVQQRLAALRADNEGRREITAAAAPTGKQSNPATLGTFAPRQVTASRQLNRAAVRPVARLGELPKEQLSVVAAAVTTLPEPVRETPTAPAEEILPGISLAGEVSNRGLIDYTTPEYPEWAKHDGVEVSVELFFTVLPNGRVKENVLIERTSGYDDFDRRALSALAAWRFESLGTGAAGEQWGRIEFKYRLKDAG